MCWCRPVCDGVCGVLVSVSTGTWREGARNNGKCCRGGRVAHGNEAGRGVVWATGVGEEKEPASLAQPSPAQAGPGGCEAAFDVGTYRRANRERGQGQGQGQVQGRGGAGEGKRPSV